MVLYALLVIIVVLIEMSGNGIRSDTVLQLIAQNVTEHHYEEETGSFYLLYLILGVSFCVFVAYTIFVV